MFPVSGLRSAMPVTQMWSAGVRGCSALGQSDPTVPPRQLHTRLLKMLACRLPPCFLSLYFHSPCTEARFGSKLSKQPKHPQGAPTWPANSVSTVVSAMTVGSTPPPAIAPPPVMRQPAWQAQLPPSPVGAQTWLSGQVPLQVGAPRPLRAGAPLGARGASQTQLPPPAAGAETWCGSGQVPVQVGAVAASHGVWQTQPVGVEAQTWPVGQVPLQVGALFSHGVWQTHVPPTTTQVSPVGQGPLQVGNVCSQVLGGMQTLPGKVSATGCNVPSSLPLVRARSVSGLVSLASTVKSALTAGSGGPTTGPI